MKTDTTEPDVEFNENDQMLVTQIVGRWRELVAKSTGEIPETLSIRMDITAANGVNGNPPLDLGRLMGFDDFNFAHDMAGIERHINRETGKIEGWFLPRCSISEPAH